MIDHWWTARRRATGWSLAVTMVAACGGGNLALPSDPPETLEIVAGDGQAGVVGAELAESLVVRVYDITGAGVPGFEVTWSVAGGGVVSPTVSVTDADGRAAASRTLGAEPGAYGTTATAAGVSGSPVVFLATAVADLPDADQSTIEAFPTTIKASAGSSEAIVTVTARDQHGNPVPGVVVVLSATGAGNNLVQPTALTNAQGVTTGRFSSRGAGGHVLSATAGGVKLTQTVLVTVLPVTVDGNQSQVDVPNGAAGATKTITIRLRDAFGNAVTGARAKLEIGVSGANPSSNLPVSETGGGNYATSYSPTRIGTDLVSVTFEGTALFGGPFASTIVAGPAAAAQTIAVVQNSASTIKPAVDIQIEVRDAFGNPTRRAGENLVVTGVFGNERRDVPVSYQPNAGLYVGTFRPWAIGKFQVEITVGGVAIPGSPFTVVRSLF